MIRIDARTEPLEDVFRRLKEMFCNTAGQELEIVVIAKNREDMQRIAAFGSMSGFRVRKGTPGEPLAVVISGISCSCT